MTTEANAVESVPLSQNIRLRPGNKKHKIIIVGAGIAGIAAASYLTKCGETDFKIIEASDRIGGRILTVSTDGGRHLDLGAGWIHGVLGNPIYELALENGLVRLADEQAPHCVVAATEDGQRIPIALIEEVYGAYFWFCKRCEEYFMLGVPCPDVDSVGAHLERDIDAYLRQFNDHPKEKKIRRLVFDHLINRETCITGVHSMHETGLSDFGSYTELPGGNVTIPTGFSSFLDLLRRKLPADCILTEHCVRRIIWKGNVEVACANGRRFSADHVLVTIPLGVLKELASELFSPPLPDYKLESIRRLSFGVVDKIYLEYAGPFLNPSLSEILTLWTSDNSPDEWFRKIYSFSRVGDSVLLAWVSGRQAELLETLSDDEVADKCTALLRNFLSDPHVPKPIRVVRSNWKNNPYSRGSYTSIGVGSSQEDIELLAKPIYSDPFQSKPVLVFAGEATHSTFYSTVHGAYLSGLRASRLLLEENVEHQAVMSLSSWIKGIDISRYN